MSIQNPHDKFFKETFSDAEVARDFIQHYLPESVSEIIDLETLEAQRDSYISQELQETFTDMLYRVKINEKTGYLYFLFEHKSYPSHKIAFQLLKYMSEIWDKYSTHEKKEALPIIIPLVIYHGQGHWHTSTRLSQMIPGYTQLPETVKDYIPDYQYLLYDLSQYQDEAIKGGVRLKILMTIFRDIFTKDPNRLRESVLKAAAYLRELENKETGIDYLEIYMRYVFSAAHQMTKADLEKILNEMTKEYPEGREVAMTLADILRKEGLEEGMKRGRMEGRMEGETQALVKTALRLLTKKFGPLSEPVQKRIQELDAATLEVMIDQVLDYQSLDDVKKYLM